MLPGVTDLGSREATRTSSGSAGEADRLCAGVLRDAGTGWEQRSGDGDAQREGQHRHEDAAAGGAPAATGATCHAMSASSRGTAATSCRSSSYASRVAASPSGTQVDLGDLGVGVGQLATVGQHQVVVHGLVDASVLGDEPEVDRAERREDLPGIPVSSATSRIAASSAVSPGFDVALGQRPLQLALLVLASDQGAAGASRRRVEHQPARGGLLHAGQATTQRPPGGRGTVTGHASMVGDEVTRSVLGEPPMNRATAGATPRP